MCQFWLSADYTASTASIFNLFILSLDRYWAITSPLRYLRRRTKKRALVLIALAWTGASMWVIPVLAWHRIAHGGVRITPSHVCETEFATNMTFKVVTSILNFYIPTTCMIVLYVRIFLAIKRRSKDIERLGAVAMTSNAGGNNGGGQHHHHSYSNYSNHCHRAANNNKAISDEGEGCSKKSSSFSGNMKSGGGGGSRFLLEDENNIEAVVALETPGARNNAAALKTSSPRAQEQTATSHAIETAGRNRAKLDDEAEVRKMKNLRRLREAGIINQRTKRRNDNEDEEEEMEEEEEGNGFANNEIERRKMKKKRPNHDDDDESSLNRIETKQEAAEKIAAFDRLAVMALQSDSEKDNNYRTSDEVNNAAAPFFQLFDGVSVRVEYIGNSLLSTKVATSSNNNNNNASESCSEDDCSDLSANSSRCSPVTLATLRSRSSSEFFESCSCSCHQYPSTPLFRPRQPLTIGHRENSSDCSMVLRVPHQHHHLNNNNNRQQQQQQRHDERHSGHRQCYRSKMMTTAEKRDKKLLPSSNGGDKDKGLLCRRCHSGNSCTTSKKASFRDDLSFSELKSQSDQTAIVETAAAAEAEVASNSPLIVVSKTRGEKMSYSSKRNYADEGGGKEEEKEGERNRPTECRRRRDGGRRPRRFEKRKWTTTFKKSDGNEEKAKTFSNNPLCVTSSSSSQSRYHPPNPNALSLAKEKKAATQLGVIVGAFIICWLPYFTLFMVVAYCGVEQCVNPTLHTTTIWFGYFNSALNPILYPLCNANFKMAFKRMLRIEKRPQKAAIAAAANSKCTPTAVTMTTRIGVRGSNL